MFMMPPDKMKKGIARRMKESNAEVRLCGTMSNIKVPCGEIARIVLNARTNPMGAPSKISVSMQIKSICDACKPARYPLLRYPIKRYRDTPMTNVITALNGYFIPGIR